MDCLPPGPFEGTLLVVDLAEAFAAVPMCPGWDLIRNQGSPAAVTSGSGQAVWWKRSGRGSWKQRICDRTYSRSSAKVPKLVFSSFSLHNLLHITAGVFPAKSAACSCTKTCANAMLLKHVLVLFTHHKL